MTITLYENFRAVFYTPFYLPQALGAFAAEGIDVNQVSDQYVDYRTAHHGHTTADTYWGGPMRLMSLTTRTRTASSSRFARW